MTFSLDCRRCNRLACFLDEVRAKHPAYHARPVPSFGDDSARLLIVGLAPGMHGANATGRPFTGDYAGILLYSTLYNYGFASQPVSVSANDKLRLQNCRITNAVRCLPPQNKPDSGEINACNVYLADELKSLAPGGVALALGVIAHKAVVKALQLRQTQFPFGHGSEFPLPGGRVLLSSYHCSRYNTQTRRLTSAMFADVLGRARTLLS